MTTDTAATTGAGHDGAEGWEPYPDDRIAAAAALRALRVEQRAAVARVTMLGPGKGNAMGPDFWREVPLVFEALDGDEGVRAVVVTGSGSNFSYGLDLSAMGSTFLGMTDDDGGLAGARTRFLGSVRMMQRSFDAVASCRKPVAAAVSGWCIGGGVDLIAACDVRYAAADAVFSIREVRVAIVADLGSLQRLPAIIGDGHLRELALTGRDFTASHAASIGLLNGVLPDRQAALDAAQGFAEEVAANPPLVVAGVKDVLDAERSSRVAEGQRYVAAWNAAFLPSHDLTEAMTAFTERRPPRYEGR